MQTRKVVMYLKATGHKKDGRIVFEPEYDDNRITEIAAYEIINGKIGDHFHSFINTEGQAIDVKAQKELGAQKLNEIEHAPFFKDIAEKLMQFIDPAHDGNTDLIVHNASYVKRHFDFAMTRAQFTWPPVENTNSITLSDDSTVGYSSDELLIDDSFSNSDFSSDEISGIASASQESLQDSDAIEKAEWTTLCEHCNLIDITALARKVGKVESKESGFNALCNRYGVDVSNRDCYSAQKDAELLAKLYIGVNNALIQKTRNHSLFGDFAKVADKSVKAVTTISSDDVQMQFSLGHSSK